jgi:trans-2,3-dihydro-3-hydroxyanthranilate isomerase
MRRPFVTLDVFTDRRFAGNPLAVVLDGEGLDSATMQAIAREFGHPETVFMLTPREAGHRARLRIFTPARELPFAGHPTVGSAVVIGLSDGAAPGSEFVLEEDIGPVRCKMESRSVAHGSARFTIPQLPVAASPAPDDAAIAAALGLARSDIGFAAFRPARWSAGIPITFVPTAGLRAIGECQPDPGKLVAALGVDPVYLFCGEAIETGHAFHARMFAPALGVREDPATGAAAAAFAGLLVAHGGLAEGEHAIAIEQGYEMGRPSLIRLVATLASGKLIAASIGGDAVIVTEGSIEA